MAEKKGLKIKEKLTPKRLALFAALITLVSFAYKITLGIISSSMILIVASISTLLVFVCKFIFYKTMDKDEATKKKAYFIMFIVALSFGILFLLFSVLKVGGIDTINKNNFSGWLSYVFVAFVMLMFGLSVFNLTGALKKDDLIVIGVKEMIFISALSDAVIIQEFLYKTIELYRKLPLMTFINNYFPLLTAIFMLVIPLLMFRRYRARVI